MIKIAFMIHLVLLSIYCNGLSYQTEVVLYLLIALLPTLIMHFQL